MDAPLSGKQKRESMKFLLDQLRDTAAFRKEQRRKDALAKQQMDHKEQTQQAKLADMSVPPKMSKPTNPEAGPSDTVPAMLTPGEAVIPAKAAQNPKNKPLIKAMVKEGRSDRNLSVPKIGLACGTTMVKGYSKGITEVPETDAEGNIIGYTTQVEVEPPRSVDIEQQIKEDRAAIKQAGIDVMRPVAAAGDVLIGGPVNAASNALTWTANTLGVPRIGRALGIYDSDVTKVEVPTIGGKGSATPYYDKVRQASINNQLDPNKVIETITPEESKSYFSTPVISNTDNATPATDNSEQVPEIISELNKFGAGSMAGDVPFLSKEEAKGYIGKELIPTDKTSFDKWTGFIGDSIKGAYESISDPEKLKGALSGTLETLGFNARDAGRFALLVAGSKALGYDTTQAVRFAGQYTLKASDQRASDEAQANKELTKSLIAKGYTYNKEGKLVPPQPEFSKQKSFFIETGRTPQPIVFNEYKLGDKTMLFHPTLKNTDGSPMSFQQYAQQKAGGRPMLEYNITEKERNVKEYEGWRKGTQDEFQKVIDDLKVNDKNSPHFKAKVPSASKFSSALSESLQDRGAHMGDAGTLLSANTLKSKVQDMILEDIKNKKYNDEDLGTYITKAELLSKPSVTKDLFTTKDGNQMPLGRIQEQFDSVRQFVGGDYAKAADKMNEWATVYNATKKDNPKLLPLPTDKTSSYAAFVDKTMKELAEAKRKAENK